MTMGANAIELLRLLLRGRIAFGRAFAIHAPKCVLRFEPGEKSSCENGEKGWVLTLTVESAEHLADRLQVKRGEYRLPELPEIVIRVVPSEIKDPTGKTVVEVIG